MVRVMSSRYDNHFLNPEFTDPARLRRERDKARQLKKTEWWRRQVNRGVCHYCEGRFSPKELTMDHVVPLARGGESKKGNLVPACRSCNQSKKLNIPAEDLLGQLGRDSKRGPDDSSEPES